MEYQSDCFIKCTICSQHNIKLYHLTNNQLLLVDKLFSCLSMKKISSLICKLCLNKLFEVKGFFRLLIKSKVLHSYSLNQMDKKPSKDHVNSYNCQCQNCQKRYGGLPLLVDVIERQHQDQPSTSSSSSAPKPSSSRKIMTCVHCNKTFNHKGDLNKHERTHTGEQPFVCSVCERKFTNTSNLARHMRLHSGDKPFSCEYCNKTFSRKDKLDLHKKSRVCQKK